MSKLDSAEKMLHETIAKLSHEVDRLSVKIKEIPILENNNNELAQKNHNLDNEIKILISYIIIAAIVYRISWMKVFTVLRIY